MKKEKTFYYKTLEDEVEEQTLSEITIDQNYKYTSNNPFYKFFEFIYFNIVMKPVAFFICKLKKVKWINKKALKQSKDTGYFIYGNHTNSVTDTFGPPIMSRKKPFFIVNSKNLNLPFFKKSTKMLGALPLANTLSAQKNFIATIEQKINKKHPIVIYPEAKIWPCYTGIRPFKTTAFKYPVKFNVPCYSMTTTYQKTKRGKCKIVIYIDGPFYPDTNLSIKENEIMLHDKIFETLTERAKNSNFETYKYEQIKGEKND